MKKIKPLVLLFALIMCICIAFSACTASLDSTGESDKVTQQPQAGEQISEAMRMYREAVAAGYKGTYLEFIEEYLKPAPPTSSDTNIVVTESGSNAGADIAALSAVKIESTYIFGYSGSVVQYPTFATEWGSGVIFSIDRENWDAYILTNYHVIYEYSSLGTEKIPHISDDIKVWLFGGEAESGKLSATFVGGAIDYDVAVLFIDGSKTVNEAEGGSHTNASVLQNSDARPVTIGDSDEISVGDTVFAIGNPAGAGISATQGIVSVEAEYITMYALNSNSRTVDFLEIRIDAAVNHGNSGGGLFNGRGEYIGTVNARSEADGVRDFGYAIPSNLTVAIARNVIEAHSRGVRRANLGITPKILSSRSVFNEKTCKTTTVQSVSIASIAPKGAVAGILQEGDILISVSVNGDKKQITREFQLTFLSFNLRAGDTAIFEVLRNGETVLLEICFKKSNFLTIY